MADTDVSEPVGIWLATTPANAFHRRLTFAVMAALFLAFLAAASFANVSFPSSDGFILYIQGTMSERLASIFGAFVTTKAHGTGLGLAICRMIIEHHGGQLTASSDGESGALFEFVLPFEPPKKASPSAA